MKKIIAALIIMAMAAALAFAGGQAPASGGPAKLAVEVFDRGTDGGRTRVDNNAWTDWIKAKVLKDLNIELTFQPVGRWSEDTDIINLMASRSAPDLCYTYNRGMIASFREQGGIMNLAPYIDRLLPDMKKLLGADPALTGQDFIYRDRDPVTGNIYSITSYQTRLSQRNVFIRKDWLDKLGLPLPTTTQQFHDALAAFRDRDPGNVGKSNVIPFAQDYDARWGLLSFVHSFFDPKMSDRDKFIYRFLEERSVTLPGYKEGMRMMNAWYNEGLIFHDYPLWRVPEDFFNMLKTGIAGAFAGNWDLPWRQDYRIAEELARNVPGAVFVPIDCIQSSDGVTHKQIMDKPGLRIFVPAFSKNPEAALKYLNWLCLYENFHFLQVGSLGVNHELVEDIPRTIGTPAGHPWFQNSANNIDYTIPMNGVEMMDPEKTSRVLAFGYGNTPPETIVNANALSIRNGKAWPVHPAETTAVKIGIYGQALRDKADALIDQAITARPADFDRIWDAGMRDFLASGAQECMDERAAIWK